MGRLLVWLVDFGSVIRWPWKKFRPGIWHNACGKCWHVSLTNEAAYTEPGVQLLVDVDLSLRSGEVVGLTIHDGDLRDCVEAR